MYSFNPYSLLPDPNNPFGVKHQRAEALAQVQGFGLPGQVPPRQFPQGQFPPGQIPMGPQPVNNFGSGLLDPGNQHLWDRYRPPTAPQPSDVQNAPVHDLPDTLALKRGVVFGQDGGVGAIDRAGVLDQVQGAVNFGENFKHGIFRLEGVIGLWQVEPGPCQICALDDKI